MLPISVIVSGISAELIYAGAAPGLTGELQVNARVPGGYVPPGPVAVELTVGRLDHVIPAGPEIDLSRHRGFDGVLARGRGVHR